jgi:hypothetical protein
MNKLFRAVVLGSALAAILTAYSLSNSAPAQEKKKGAVKEAVGVTEVYKAKDGWRFRVKNNEGKSVAIGTRGFDTQEEVENMVDFVKNTLSKGKINVIKDK